MQRRGFLKALAGALVAPVVVKGAGTPSPEDIWAEPSAMYTVPSGHTGHVVVSSSQGFTTKCSDELLVSMSRDLAEAAGEHRDRLAWSLIVDTFSGHSKESE